MTERRDRDYLCCDGVRRRDCLKVGLLGLGGLTLSGMLRFRAARAEEGRATSATSVIFVELAGGPPQHETYDPKPLAPVEFRGIYGTAKTKIPGVVLGERMPHQAKVMDKLAIIRSMRHDSGSHRTSSHLTQTGYYLRDRQNNENEMPCAGSLVSKIRGANAPGIPAYVAVPSVMRFGDAAWLGHGYNAFATGGDPSDKDYRVRNLSLASGLDVERVSARRELRQSLDQSKRLMDTRGVAESVDDFARQAFQIVAGDRARDAFQLEQENPELRDRYGRNSTGQSMLLARRLVEAGATFVTVRSGGWDMHWDLDERMDRYAAPFDQGIAALVEDVYDRGLDRDVLIVAMGEFGRTPRMNDGRGSGTPGRDHWGNLMSVMISGGGLRVGQVVGASNDKGEEPIDSPYRPENVLAMVYRHLEIDPQRTFSDHSGRPRYLLEERGLIQELI
jgi:hypothetical protein